MTKNMLVLKIAGELKEVFAKAYAEDIIVVTDGGAESTLSVELGKILAEIALLPTESDVSSAISSAIDALIDGAPATYDTLKEIASYIASHADVVAGLNAAIGNKVDKESGKGLSANDFTDALKSKLEGLKAVTASTTNGYIKLDGTDTKVYTHPTGAGSEHIPAGGTEGQILTKTASGYGFADAPKGVRYGASVPGDLADGELFVQTIQS